MWRVDTIWMDDKNAYQVGVRISTVNQVSTVLDVDISNLFEYRGKFVNADVTGYGVRKKRNMQDIPREILTRHTGKLVSTYTLMHADTVVLMAYETTGIVEVVSPQHVPFALRGRLLTYISFFTWITDRVNNLSRTYMNVVYIARQVGRDFNAILRDSCAISVTDKFWIKCSDVNTSWEKLVEKRDKSIELVQVALTGKIKKEAFKQACDDTTSLFTLKGAFPKALLKEKLLKQGFNAEYEVAGCMLGNFLGISVAQAKMRKSDNIISCRLFTSDSVSLVHASELENIANIRGQESIHADLYLYFKRQGRNDIVGQLERLYILNYLAENMDFHAENFGFLYNVSTFNILRVAPAYDFNSAFDGWCDVGVVYNAWLGLHMLEFISRHPDIQKRLSSDAFSVLVKSLPLNRKEQFDSIIMRANYLLTE